MKNVFLTGATGTIGSALVPRLLDDSDTLVKLLIRAGDDDELRTRRDKMFTYWGLRSGDTRAERIRILRGDISQPDFGVGAADWDQLGRVSTHLIHCAATVKLNMPEDLARATAVVPTCTMLDLGRRCAHTGVLRKIDLVSTVGVWGRTPGHMPERALPEVSHFHNTYEAAKAEAERVIWAEGGGLPITVHRPSMVVGESGTGRVIHFQVFYHLCEFLSGIRSFGIMPHLGSTRLDTVPVDWVADVIRWSSFSDQTVGKILHLCSGPSLAMPLPRLQARVRQAWAARGRKLPRLRQVNTRCIERLLPWIGSVAGERTRRALRALPPVLAYLAEDQGFSNDRTMQALRAAGLSVPPAETYLDAVLGFYLDAHGTGSPA